MKTIFKIFLFTLLLASFSCKKSDNNNSNTTYQYPMQVRMTDAAGPYDAVYIDVQSIQVLSDNNSSNWVTLNTTARIYDLTRLVNGKDTFLAAATLSSGAISQIRLILGTNNSVVVNGVSYPLKTPSAQQSGLKLNVHYTMTAGVTYVVLLDFDANRSIVKQGNGDYSLKPVIHTTTLSASGAIKGVVTPVSTHPVIYAITGSDTVSTLPDITGNFMFSGMAASTYTVAFAPAPPLSVKVINNVSVTVGNVTDVGIISIP